MIWTIVLIVYSATFFIKSDFRTDDLNVYIPYIKGLYEGVRLGNQYDYQGFYWITSIALKIYNRLHSFPIVPTILSLGFINLITSTSLFIWLAYTYQRIWTYFKQQFSKRDRFFIILILIYSIVQFWYIAYPTYGNTFRRVAVVWILFSFIKYIENRSRKTILIISLEFLLLVNFSSTGIFLSFFLLYAFLNVLTATKDEDILFNIWLMSPAFSVWSILYMPSFWPVVMFYHLIMIVLFITRSFKIVDVYWSKTQPFILFGTPILFFLLSILFPHRFNSYMPWINFFINPEFEMLVHYLRFDFSNINFAMLSIVNIVFWAVFLAAITITLRKKVKIYQSTISYILFVTLLTFFNPLVARFVISNFTNLAYFRIYDILFNPITLIVCFSIILDNLPIGWINKSFKIIGIFTLLIGIISSNVWSYLDFSGKTHPLYHVDKEEVRVLEQLEEYIEKEQMSQPVRIVTQIYGTHLLTDMSVLIQNSTRIDNQPELFQKSDERSILDQIFLIKDGYITAEFEQPFSETCRITKHFNTDFVILNAQYNWDVEHGLGYCAEKVIEVGNYRVFRMRFEWLD